MNFIWSKVTINMKFLIFVSLSVLTVIFGSSSAVVYTRCQLAQLLLNNGFPYCKLRNCEYIFLQCINLFLCVPDSKKLLSIGWNFNLKLFFLGVCLVESENSARDTSLQTNQNGTQNLGLFQINDTNWCLWPSHSTPTGGGGCNALCFSK